MLEKLTKVLVFIGVLCVFYPQLIVNLIVTNMKILKWLLILIKFVYYLIKNIGYQAFVDAWKQANL